MVLSFYSILSYALVLDLGNATHSLISNQKVTNLTVATNAHCTTDDTWLTPRFPDMEGYDFTCHDALFKVWRNFEYISSNPDTELEFLDRGAAAQTTKPKIHLPRKYTVCK